jgi:branched-chain amino acid transport system ATP-binding protein
MDARFGGREQPTTSNTRASTLLECQNISRTFGGLRALKGVSLDVCQGEIFGLVGPNGSGKTTLLNAIAGFFPPQEGKILFEGRDITGMRPHRVARLGIARTFQNLALFRGMSTLDNILVGRHIHMNPRALATALYWWWAKHDEVRERRKVEEIIDILQLEEIRAEPIDIVPLGLQKRVELARALAAEPKLLVLDEPMAGMNQEEKEYMARFILDVREASGITVLMIEHHMDVVASLCDRMVVLNYGEMIASGKPKEVLSEPRVIEAYLGKGRAHAA